MIAVEYLHIHPGLIVVPFREALADNLHQIRVAQIVLRKQYQMIIPILASRKLLVKPGVRRHIDLAAQNGLDTCGLGGPVEINHAVHDTVVGDGGAVHSQLLHSGHIFLYFVGTVQKRILRVDMKMCKCHGRTPLC